MEKCRDDYFFFKWSNQKILSDTGQIVNFDSRHYQKKFAEDFVQDWTQGALVRYNILKARKEGFTTEVESLFYWILMFYKNYTALIMAHDRPTANEIFSIFKRYHEHSLDPFRHPTINKSRNHMRFGEERVGADGEKYTTGLNSQVKTLSALSPESGRGWTPQLLHISELGSYSKRIGPEIDASLLNSVADAPFTAIVRESTGKNLGSYWHQKWDDGDHKDSVFKNRFYDWTKHPRYTSPEALDKSELTKEEKKITKNYDVNLNQLKWRRGRIRSLGSVEKFKSEFPLSPEEAFSYSGSNIFNPSQLQQLYNLGKKFPHQYAKLVLDTPDHQEGIITPGDISLKYVRNSSLKIWNEPQFGAQYIIGADVALGRSITKGDYSVATVIDPRYNKVVARFRQRIAPEDYGDMLIRIGLYYNTALLGVENNSMGFSVIMRLLHRNYPNMYKMNRNPMEMVSEKSHSYGWETGKNKADMINRVAEFVDKGKLYDFDTEFILEAQRFIEDESGRMAAESGHDDIVMSVAIALQLYDERSIIRQYKDDPIYSYDDSNPDEFFDHASDYYQSH